MALGLSFLLPATNTVTCHFCSSTLHLISAGAKSKGKGRARATGEAEAVGEKHDFICEDGQLVSTNPAFYDPSLNPLSRASPTRTLAKSPSSTTTPFCRTCLSNQSLQVHLLASFPSSSDSEDDSDSDTHKPPHLLPDYLASLDSRYPLVCANCQPAVEDAIREKDYKAKAEALGWRLRLSRMGKEKNERERRKAQSARAWEWWAMGVVWRIRGVLWWCSHAGLVVLWTAVALTPGAFLEQSPSSWPLYLAATSFFWTFWNPTWDRARKERARGRKPEVVGKTTFIIVQALSFVLRFCLAVAYRLQLLGDLETIQRVFLSSLVFSVAAFSVSLTTLHVKSPVHVRLTSNRSLSRGTSVAPIDPLDQVADLSLTPRGSPQSTPPSTLRRRGKPRPPLPNPAFGVPAFPSSIAQQHLYTNGNGNDETEMDVGYSDNEADVSMDWEPTPPPSALRGGRRNTSPNLTLAPQRFFAPQQPSGLEEILAKGLRVSDDDEGGVLLMDAAAHPELAKCSREVLIEMVARHKRELAEAVEKNAGLEEEKGELVGENRALERDFENAKGKIDDLLNEESRMEAELAGRIEVLDKLRSSVRELERERRDGEKRYREQGESFDSERQAWYDQEAHYKLRIANLSKSNRKPRQSDLPARPSKEKAARAAQSHSSGSESDPESSSTSFSGGRPSRRASSPLRSVSRSSTASPSPSTAPTANELALQDQLATLTTAHTSLSTTLRALQTELSELKRVYQDLQEENESYEILLGEKTLNGTVQGTEFFRRNSLWNEDGMLPGGGLPSVGEDSGEEEEEEESGSEEESEVEDEDIEKVLLESQGTGSPNSGAVAAGTTGGRRNTRKPKSSGGGLDLAAELEAAQLNDDEVEKKAVKKKKKQKKDETQELVAEIKGLKEANKALTLYVSKIVDRVCSQEGFEKVLAVDYRLATPKLGGTTPPPPPPPDNNDGSKTRNFFRNSAPPPPSETNNNPRRDSLPPTPSSTTTSSAAVSAEKGRRGLFDSVSSVFGGFGSKPSPVQNPALKPFRLSIDGARKLEIEEDEDDIRERERLRAELQLHGIEDNIGNSWGKPSPPLPPIGYSPKVEGAEDDSSQTPTASRRPISDEKLDMAKPFVEEQMRAIAEKEKEISAEIEKGKSSGFTEPKPRRSRTRPGSMSSSRTSSSQGGSNVGLGILDEAAGALPSPPITSSSPATSPSPEQEGGEEGWGKKLRRMSRGWTSPPVS
ncbi:hypothetical protein MNV49_000971 [Pseudohyphozyma bogoriensis]|nr:hypothetical protein MNV49_000971 [Pseudohyphozyma bogoriensis]